MRILAVNLRICYNCIYDQYFVEMNLLRICSEFAQYVCNLFFNMIIYGTTFLACNMIEYYGNQMLRKAMI